MASKRLSLSIMFILYGALLAPAIANSGESKTDKPASPGVHDEKSRALGNLIQLSQTSIGTSQKSADLAPGIISILDKEQMIAAGVRTVSEALSLLPGFNQPEPQITDDEPVLRGIGGIFTGSSGKILYLINGTSSNNSISANSSLVLQMPIEQVVRIEVLRGPGSAVYGEYALLGVINIVTDQEDEQVYARAGSFDSYSGGGNFTVRHSNDLRSSFNLAYSETGGASINSGPDILYSIGQSAISNAPGQPNNERRLLSGFYDLSAENWSFSAFLLSEDRGDGFGSANALSLPQKYVQSASQAGLELKVQQNVGKWTADYQLAAKQFERQYDDLFILPAGVFGVYKDGAIASSNEAELRYEGGIDFFRAAAKHEIFLGFDVAHSESKDIRHASNLLHHSRIPGTPLALPLPAITPQPLGLESRTRDIVSAYFSDQYQLNDQLELVTGLRIDHYSDINDSSLASPRLAGTYQLSERNLFKFQVARAFRPPSFTELYYLIGGNGQVGAGNPDLNSEIMDTLELAHTFRLPDTVLRTTLFASEVSDLIRIDQTRRFQNALDVQTNGAEFEIEHRPYSGLLWFGNASYVDATDKKTGEALEGSTRWLGNAGITWQPSGRYSSTLRYQYIGDRFRSPTDTRANLAAYSTWNISGYINDFLSDGLALHLGINNLLDEDTRNPSLQPGYADDYPGAGRTYWVQLNKSLK